jgi:hypothetical protein
MRKSRSVVELTHTELRRRRVSLTCTVDWHGHARWWLVRESGQLPPTCANFTCWDGCECNGACSLADGLAHAYMVFVVAGSESEYSRPMVVVADLGVRTMNIVRGSVSRIVRVEKVDDDGEAGTVSRQLCRICRNLSRGMMSALDSCDCVLGEETQCSLCRGVSPLQRVFILQEQYEGVKPFGEKHWWRGVTDAVDAATLNCTGWLVCAH